MARGGDLGDELVVQIRDDPLQLRPAGIVERPERARLPLQRAGIELTLETAKELRAAIDRAIAAAEFEEAEVRGKGASLVRAA